MTRQDYHRFSASLSAYQMMEFIDQMNVQMRAYVNPLLKTERKVEFEHYIGIPVHGSKPLFVCVDVDYTCENFNAGFQVTRTIHGVRIYEHEVEMEFYMSLSEKAQPYCEENLVLFN